MCGERAVIFSWRFCPDSDLLRNRDTDAPEHRTRGSKRSQVEAASFTPGLATLRLRDPARSDRAQSALDHRIAMEVQKLKSKCGIGGPGGNRTHNLSIKSRMLCQLSYRSVQKGLKSRSRRLVSQRRPSIDPRRILPYSRYSANHCPSCPNSHSTLWSQSVRESHSCNRLALTCPSQTPARPVDSRRAPILPGSRTSESYR